MSSATLAGVDAAAAARLAEPGDADLDLDVCDVRLTSVVRVGHELWVRGTGGFGRWAEDGTMVEVSDVRACGQFSLRFVVSRSDELAWRTRRT